MIFLRSYIQKVFPQYEFSDITISPLVKGFPPSLTLIWFLPSMNTSQLGEGWTKAEGLSTFTIFTGFLLSVTLHVLSQGRAVVKGSLIFLHSKGFCPLWILLGQIEKGEWRLFHIHCTQGSSPVRTLTWWMKKTAVEKGLPTYFALEVTFSGVGNIIWDKNRPDTRDFPTFFAFIRLLLSVNLL